MPAGVRMKAVFSKTGEMVFISHLDLVRLFQRSSRRADIPVEKTKGFSPRLKISIARALKLGVESVNEEAVFYLEHPMAPADFMERLNNALPEGVRVLGCREERINA